MKYKIITGVTSNKERGVFQKDVNEAINEGWEPIGGVSLQMSFDSEEQEASMFFAQAMIKRS